MYWQCCLAGSSKTAPRIFIFSIVLGAECLSYVESIATFALIFFGYIISVLSSAVCQSYSLDHQSQARGQTKASLTWNRASYTAHRETKLCREVLTMIGSRSEKRKRKTSLLNLEFWVNFSVVTYVFSAPYQGPLKKRTEHSKFCNISLSIY